MLSSTNRKLKVAYCNISDQKGGAAIGGFRTFKSIQDYCGDQVDISMFVSHKFSNESNIYEWPRTKRSYIYQLFDKFQSISPLSLRSRAFSACSSCLSPALFSYVDISRFDLEKYDLLNLHWVADGFLSIEDIGRLNVPIVWKLADEWMFSGAQHYELPENKTNPLTPYNYINYQALRSLNQSVFNRKLRSWSGKQFHLVCPSNWLASKASSSEITRDMSIHVIPNCLDLDFWKPAPKKLAKLRLGLSPNTSFILFSAGDKRKGFDIFEKALATFHSNSSLDLELIVCGINEPLSSISGFKVHSYPYLSAEELLLLYQAADVFLMASVADNLPNSVLEAQSCGLPVVGFNIGGMPDAIDSGSTGFLVDDLSPQSLGQSLQLLVENSHLCNLMAISSRQRSENIWHPSISASSYLDVYRQALCLN